MMNLKDILTRFILRIIASGYVVLFVSNVILQAQSTTCNFLCNSDFERPGLAPGTFRFIGQSNVPCWKTTASNGVIEIWGSGFNGVPSFSGVNFAELNATQVSTLFQDFIAPLGSSVQISFAHRGRAGTDVMSVSIGPVGGPYVDLGNFSAGRTAWVYNNINYAFPSTGSSNYTIRFNSISAAGGATVGNFLDAVSITYPMPSISFDITTPSCNSQNSGSIQTSITGGTPPYSFSWAPPVVSSSAFLSNVGPGNYIVTVTDFYGCSVSKTATIINTTLPLILQINKTICQGQSYTTVNGIHVTQPGVYIDTVKGGGCDSIFIQNINVQNLVTDTINAIICQGESYSFNAAFYSQSGIYSDTLQTAAGCDSFIILKLTVNPSDTSVIRSTICEGDSFLYNGNSYQQAGIYYQSLRNVLGCDSIVIVNLEVSNINRDTVSASVCVGETYIFQGNQYNTTGTYIHKLVNSSGCDSLKILILSVVNSKTNTIEHQICSGGIYILPDGTATDSSGVYTSYLTTSAGCDSIITTFLDIFPVYDMTLYDTVCERQLYLLPDGNSITGAGTYRVVLKSVYGCDSVFTVNLSQNNNPEWMDLQIFPTNPELKRGDTLFINSQTDLAAPLLYTWLPSTGLSCYDCANPFFWGSTSSAYQLIVTDTNGCRITSDIQIKVTCDCNLFVPNVFTPNGDGSNDYWQIFGDKESIKQLNVQIYNRWGERVFSSDDIDFGWDGTYKSELQAPGVFVYVLNVVWFNQTFSENYKGSITLLK